MNSVLISRVLRILADQNRFQSFYDEIFWINSTIEEELRGEGFHFWA
jgi:hypothetical protein